MKKSKNGYRNGLPRSLVAPGRFASGKYLRLYCTGFPVYARIFAQKVMALVKSIPAYPEIGRMVPEYNTPELRDKIYGNYRIVYRVKPSMIEIAAICHGARQLESALSNPGEQPYRISGQVFFVTFPQLYG